MCVKWGNVYNTLSKFQVPFRALGFAHSCVKSQVFFLRTVGGRVTAWASSWCVPISRVQGRRLKRILVAERCSLSLGGCAQEDRLCQAWKGCTCLCCETGALQAAFCMCPEDSPAAPGSRPGQRWENPPAGALPLRSPCGPEQLLRD